MRPAGSDAPGTPVSAFPWDAVLTLGLATLRWRPRDLWAATPRELAAAAGLIRPAPDAPSRADLDRLLAAYPDPGTPR
ncbi:phage tail assembly chaperone [Methylobacterium sp. R2-1]|uniref:phage tail assembly chaperone n=1 Tax=Methylobacterium sp. R2-1 TaxID=2587064 RepID=UPI001615DF2B|nr:phage tail assembly chaperone [Methylobacterium sp. R2-1]MBB2960559.1 putative phage protein (TIGR02216 family) [Methylobacterium sp. R2-1]